ncbi:MAG: hypothetical protein HYY23_18075 [Verrucomicrobia bacterium]|nr:hypothetical protein [Verrucomicrobiota bacterium]
MGPKPTGSVEAPLTVKYNLIGSAIKWVDYRMPDGSAPDSVVIPAGKHSVALAFHAVDDGDFEGLETARLILFSDSAYILGTPLEASIGIEDNDPLPESRY